ncbi:hypothetical protein MN210_17955 [Psychrobacter raelei]|uniref:Uncharacterized protein n=1 Tax=Psychrobacter raelei TaxID=2565531 RepID=A0AAU6PWS3_9GAMM
MFGFFKKKNHIKSVRLINIIPTTFSNSLDTCFQDAQRDLENFMDASEDLEPNLLMPILYTSRLATAGLYHQGLQSKEDFDISDQSHFSLMVKIGNDITRQQQIDFQEKSLDYSMELLRIYYPTFKKEVSSALIVSAKNGVSIFQALQQALNEKLKDDALSNEICSSLVTPQFCTAFINSRLWDPVNDDFALTSQKLWAYFKSKHYDDFQYLFITDDEKIDNYIVSDIYSHISSEITDSEMAYQFILEELDAASHGNEEAIRFVNNTPFTKEEYEGALLDSSQPTFGVNNPQLTLTNLISQTGLPASQTARLRIEVVQKIIDDWYDEASSNEDVDLDILF